ncbi:MAG: aminotransferase class V-fold PLP-dependent enzyme [Desulfobacterales bacterium]|nr:aminotransferase class V-fold PLP-dependent enzyme [Desulfobacterales bacterium]
MAAASAWRRPPAPSSTPTRPNAAGKIPVDVEAWKADYLTLSRYKIYGPKGIGALYARKGAPLVPLIRGGHQEIRHRAGTYNNLGILGFGAGRRTWPCGSFRNTPPGCGACGSVSGKGIHQTHALRPRQRPRDGGPSEHPEPLLPRGRGREHPPVPRPRRASEVSTGSACASGSLEPSHVLLATGVGPELAHGSIRFSLGRDSTEADVDYVIGKLPPSSNASGACRR